MLSLLLVMSMLCAECSFAIQVETTYGTVEGLTEILVDDYHSGIELNTFYSIPFAKPPVGDLRFAAPEEPDPYEDVFVADQLSSACEQSSGLLIWLTQPGWNDYNEDCLHLSIYAPADQSNGPYPVMIWIYGGSYQSGANVQYLGHFLAAQGVVVVIPNYRLGIFGFAWTGDDVIPGNMGLMDQALAMQYVQDNIAAFGGDPDMVTIFGESAGAGSVGLQLMSPRTEGLFHQAILESGCEYVNWALNGPQHEPENYLKEVAEKLECPTEDTTEMATCLRSKNATELMTTSFSCSPGRTCLGFAPVVDGEGGFIPDVPVNLRMREEFHKVPEMIGINRHESFLSVVGPGMNNMTHQNFEFRIRQAVGRRLPIFPDPEREEDAVQALLFYYSPWPHLEDSEMLRHQYGEIMTDTSFGAAADLQAKEHSPYAPTYFYVYDYMSEDTLPDYVGTPHGMEIVSVFGLPFVPLNPDVQNQTGISDIIDYDKLDEEYAYFVMTLWANFAKFGNPTPQAVPAPGDHDPITWETYTEDNLNYIYIGRDVLETAEDFRQHEYAFWQQYMSWIVLGEDGIILPRNEFQLLVDDVDANDEEPCVLENCLVKALLQDD